MEIAELSSRESCFWRSNHRDEQNNMLSAQTNEKPITCL